MAERIVCNASPLIFLSKLDNLSLLDVYDLHVPAQVEAEILQGAKHKKQDAVNIADYLRARRIKPVKVLLKVLIDEAKARTVARFKGLAPKGTLGILWDAYKAGIVDKEDLESLTLDLIQKGYRIKEEIIVDFLRKLKTDHR